MPPEGPVQGAAWSALNAAVTVVLPLAIFVFFAHVLAPASIGLVALALSCAEILKALGVPGLYEALLQQSDDRQRCHETALFVLLGAGALLLPLYLVLVGLLGAFVPDVGANRLALGAIGLRIVFDLVVLQPQARLAEMLAFRRLALRSVLGNLLAGALGVTIGLLGYALTGLVVYLVGQSALGLLIAVGGSHALARPRLHRDCLLRLRRETGFASVTRLIAASNNYLDQVIVAAVIGSVPLAWFNLAKRVETSLVGIAASFAAILFQPVFARGISGQRGEALRRALAIITVTCGFPAAFFLVDHQAVVRVLFGARWLPAAPVMALLALSGFARGLAGVHGAMLSVSFRNRQLMLIAGTAAVSGILIVLIVAPFGLVWCAVALAVKSALVALAEAYTTRFETRHVARTWLTTVIAPFGAALIGAGFGQWAASHLLHSDGPGVGTFATLGALLLSGTLATSCGFAWFAWHFADPIRVYLRSAKRARA